MYQKQEFPRRNEGQNRINDRIRVSQVRLVDQNGNQVGIVSIQEALQKAQFAALDLVEIAPAAQPPVCRIMNYGKFLYEQQKKEKDARKKQHIMQLKEIKNIIKESGKDGFELEADTHYIGLSGPTDVLEKLVKAEVVELDMFEEEEDWDEDDDNEDEDWDDEDDEDVNDLDDYIKERAERKN